MSSNQFEQQRFTLRRDNVYYMVFKTVKTIFCLFSPCMYTNMAAIGFQGFQSSQFQLLVVMETLFLANIVLHFFLQPLNESGQCMNVPWEKLVIKYLRGKFLWDLITIIPFGALEYYNESLMVLWLVKVIRILEVK